MYGKMLGAQQINAVLDHLYCRQKYVFHFKIQIYLQWK